MPPLTVVFHCYASDNGLVPTHSTQIFTPWYSAETSFSRQPLKTGLVKKHMTIHTNHRLGLFSRFLKEIQSNDALIPSMAERYSSCYKAGKILVVD